MVFMQRRELALPLSFLSALRLAMTGFWFPIIWTGLSVPTGVSAAPLETVTVVATRTEKSLDDLPEAVSVITAASIRDEQASSIAEVLDNLAGVDTAGGPRMNAQSVVIRGVGGSRVLYNIDGSRQSFEGGHRGRFVIDPALIERVDMLRGPASAQYGSGAIGGVLAIRTRDARDMLAEDRRIGALLRSGYESSGDQWSNSLTAYATPGPFDIVIQRSRQSSVDFSDGSDEKVEHTADGLDSQLFKISTELAANHRLSALHIRSEQDNRTPSNAAQAVDSDNPLLDRLNITESSSLGYRYTPGNRLSVDINGYHNRTRITEDRVGAPRHDELQFLTDGANLTLSFAANDKHHLITGLDSHEDRSDASRDSQPRPQFPDAEQRMQGMFLQYETDISERLTLIAALRHDRYHSASNTDAADDVDESKSTGRLGASFFASDWLTLHANYTEAYRAPNLLENYAAGIHFLGNEFQPNPELRPETAANQELGFVIQRENHVQQSRLRIRGNLYRNTIDDFIETLVTVEENTLNFACLGPNPPPGCVFGTISIEGTTTAVNLPKARITGWELEAAYQYQSWLAELAWGRSRGESLADERPLLNIPADAVKLHVAWEPESWALGARVNHFRDQNRVPPADINGGAVHRTAGYTLLDLYARWQPELSWAEKLTLNLGVDNATDRRYRSHLSQLHSPGRSFRVGFSYSI